MKDTYQVNTTTREEGASRNTQLGTRIRHARLARGLTLQAMAKAIDCSVSTLSKIENRKSNPSITMLHKICMALGINMAVLFAEGEDGCAVVMRATERPVIETKHHGHGIVLQRLVPSKPGSLLQGNLHVIEPGGYSTEGLQHAGEEMGYVLEGVLELKLDGKTYIVQEGDSFFFRSDTKHSYGNPSSSKRATRVIWVNTPPTF